MFLGLLEKPFWFAGYHTSVKGGSFGLKTKQKIFYEDSFSQDALWYCYDFMVIKYVPTA